MSKGTDFEIFFVDSIAERLVAMGMSHNEFGRLVFGEADGGRLWRSVRDPQNTGKRRKLSLGETYTIAEVLGTDLPSLMWQVAQAITAK